MEEVLALRVWKLHLRQFPFGRAAVVGIAGALRVDAAPALLAHGPAPGQRGKQKNQNPQEKKTKMGGAPTPKWYHWF